MHLCSLKASISNLTDFYPHSLESFLDFIYLFILFIILCIFTKRTYFDMCKVILSFTSTDVFTMNFYFSSFY